MSGATYICTTADDSAVSACAYGFWKDETGTADVCTECTVVGDAVSGATYICTTADDSAVSGCADGFWKDETGTADVCTECTVVGDAVSGATYICTTADDSAVSACADGFWKDENGTADVCTECTAVGNEESGATYICTSADDSDVSGCADGFWEDEKGTADACTECTAVHNAESNATYMCTTAYDTDVSGCADGFGEDETGTADICTACPTHFFFNSELAGCTACPVGTYNFPLHKDPTHAMSGVSSEAADDTVYSQRAHYYPKAGHAYHCLDDVSDYCIDMYEHDCRTNAACRWYVSARKCALRDPCVKKTKRKCRSASQCNWGMDTGICHENDNNMINPSADVCSRKSWNGCINDFFCQWNAKGHCVTHPCRIHNKRDCVATGAMRCMWDSSRGRCDTSNNRGSESGSFSFRH